MNSAFPKLFAIGTGYIQDIFDGEVEITEKIDGSQFGFGKKDGKLFARSKGKLQDLDNPDAMFTLGVGYVKSIEHLLPEGYTFYGEYLNKPKHSTLAYDRIPKNYIALFGVKKEDETFIDDYDGIKVWADKLEVDTVPLLYKGKVNSHQELLGLLDTVSYLGGQKIEGFVAKRYTLWLFGGIPMAVMGGKYVSEAFKEVHRRDWTADNTTKGRFEKFKASYRTEARWNKAIQHLEEAGNLQRTPQDIGNLIKEVKLDITTEEKEEIKNFLWSEFSGDILGHAVKGLPEFYKQKLMEESFNGRDEDTRPDTA